MDYLTFTLVVVGLDLFGGIMCSQLRCRVDNTLKSLYFTYLRIFDSSEYYTYIVIYCRIVLFNLDIEMWMDVTSGPDILVTRVLLYIE